MIKLGKILYIRISILIEITHTHITRNVLCPLTSPNPSISVGSRSSSLISHQTETHPSTRIKEKSDPALSANSDPSSPAHTPAGTSKLLQHIPNVSCLLWIAIFEVRRPSSA